MIEDVEKIDLTFISSQAFYTSANDGEQDYDLNLEFLRELKEQLNKQATVEAFIEWLDIIVEQKVIKISKQNGRSMKKRAQEFLLKWSYFGARILHNMTLNNAASFGSLHLMQMLLNEYVALAIESQFIQEKEAELQSQLQRHMKSESNPRQFSGTPSSCFLASRHQPCHSVSSEDEADSKKALTSCLSTSMSTNNRESVICNYEFNEPSASEVSSNRAHRSGHHDDISHMYGHEYSAGGFHSPVNQAYQQDVYSYYPQSRQLQPVYTNTDLASYTGMTEEYSLSSFTQNVPTVADGGVYYQQNSERYCEDGGYLDPRESDGYSVLMNGSGSLQSMTTTTSRLTEDRTGLYQQKSDYAIESGEYVENRENGWFILTPEMDQSSAGAAVYGMERLNSQVQVGSSAGQTLVNYQPSNHLETPPESFQV